MKMSGAVIVAIAASVGNFLQGWDNATIAGAVLYIKREFNLESEPTIEGLIVAMSLIGSTITTFSGAVADSVGRRPILILSSVLYFLSGLIMLWSPNVYVLLLGRLIDGFGIGLALTIIPLYISETAPPEVRGSLNTFPQFSGSGGLFLSYCLVFGMSLTKNPNWRLILGVISVPSVIYFALAVLYLPESPRWLVSKGRIPEARKVLQRLRGGEDVEDEIRALVGGLEVGKDTSLEEYFIGPPDELTDDHAVVDDKEKIAMYGHQGGSSLFARPSKGGSILGSAVNRGNSVVDPLVSLFGSMSDMPPPTGSMRGGIFPNAGSTYSAADQNFRPDQWDEESVSVQRDDEDYANDGVDGGGDASLQQHLLSREATGMESAHIRMYSSMTQDNGLIDVGGGWQLAWRHDEREGVLKRVYIRPETAGAAGSMKGSVASLPHGGSQVGGEFAYASALVSKSALNVKELLGQPTVGPAIIQPSEAADKGPSWKDLLEPGVKHALLIGIGLQIFQQFTGINGVLYYTPQILEQAGVDVLLSDIGLSSDSASILISTVTTVLMLPAIMVAMRLMDVSGRRSLLLRTIPVLIGSLIVLVTANLIGLGEVPHAVISISSVVVYLCSFVMAFGPVPNILCSEIFPTRVRGLCIAICALTYWIADIIVTYSLPLMLNSIGLTGVFGIYAVFCIFAFVFVYVKVPETKGMSLEVITELLAYGAKQVQASKSQML